MKRTKVLSPKQIPTRLPIWTTVTLWLLMDRLQPPSWAWGVVATLWTIIWIVCAVSFFTQDSVELKELQ